MLRTKPERCQAMSKYKFFTIQKFQ